MVVRTKEAVEPHDLADHIADVDQLDKTVHDDEVVPVNCPPKATASGR